MIPKNDVFVMTGETAPVLACRNYKECVEELRAVQPVQILTATFVLNAATVCVAVLIEPSCFAKLNCKGISFLVSTETRRKLPKVLEGF